MILNKVIAHLVPAELITDGTQVPLCRVTSIMLLDNKTVYYHYEYIEEEINEPIGHPLRSNTVSISEFNNIFGINLMDYWLVAMANHNLV